MCRTKPFGAGAFDSGQPAPIGYVNDPVPAAINGSSMKSSCGLKGNYAICIGPRIRMVKFWISWCRHDETRVDSAARASDATCQIYRPCSAISIGSRDSAESVCRSSSSDASETLAYVSKQGLNSIRAGDVRLKEMQYAIPSYRIVSVVSHS